MRTPLIAGNWKMFKTVRESVAFVTDLASRLAGARGTTAVTVEASDTAEPFFVKRGYSGQQRNTVSIGDEWLTNTTMKKSLSGETPGQPS